MMATSCEGFQKQDPHAPSEPVIGCAISSGFEFILLASRVHARPSAMLRERKPLGGIQLEFMISTLRVQAIWII